MKNLTEPTKLTVMIQYVGHVINAGGSVEYRHVEIHLTPEQSQALTLHDDEHFGPVAFSMQEVKS